MSFTISINEEAAFEVLFAGPAGPTGPQGIQGIQGVPGQGVAAGGTTGQVLKKLSSTNYDTGWSSDISGVAWGAITGTLSAQTDLQTALDAKLSTSAASSTYLPLAGGYITGDIQSLTGSEFRTFQGTNSSIIRSNQIQLGDSVGTLTVDAEGISFNSSPFKQTLPFLGLAGYATEGWVTANFYPLASNPSGFLTASALTPYSTTVQADALYYPLTGNPSGFLTSAPVTSVAGKVGAVTLDNTDISGLGSLAVVNDAPSDSAYYSRRNAGWEQTLGPDAPWNGTIYGRQDGFWVPTGAGIAWGEITGTLSYQTDLQSALDLKLDATVAATTYYLQTNPDGFITSAALTGYATETFVTTQGYITQATADGFYYSLNNPSGFIGDAPSDGSTYGRNNGAWTVAGGGGIITSVTSPLAVNSGDLSIDLSGYAALSGAIFSGSVTVGAFNPDPTPTNIGEIWYNALLGFLRYYDGTSTKSVASQAWSSAAFYPLSGNPSGFLTSAPVASVAGKVGAVTLDNTDISGLGSLAVVNDAPSDGSTYGRNNGAWTVAGGGGSYLPLAGGALDADASVTASDTSTLTDSELAGWGLGVQLTADHTKGTTVEFNGLDTYDGASHMQVTPTGLTFPDSTTQTTAANPFDGGTVTNPIQHFNAVGDITFGVAGSSSYMMSVEDIGNTVRFDFGYNSISNYDANVGSVNVGLSHAGAVLTSNNPATLAYVVDGVRLDYSGLNFSLTAPGIIYARSTIFFQDSTQQSTAGIPEAPNDGNYYVRKNNAWYMCSTASVYDTSSNPVTVLTV